MYIYELKSSPAIQYDTTSSTPVSRSVMSRIRHYLETPIQHDEPGKAWNGLTATLPNYNVCWRHELGAGSQRSAGSKRKLTAGSINCLLFSYLTSSRAGV